MILYSHHNTELLYADLDTALDKLYTVDYLWTLAQRYFYPITGKAAPEKRPLKPVLVEFLSECYQSEKILTAFYNQLPPAHQKLLSALCWEGSGDMETFEHRFNVRMVEVVNKREHGRTVEELVLNPAFSWLIIDTTTRPYYFVKEPRADLSVQLLPAMLSLFRLILPKPTSYYLNPQAEPSGAQTFRADQETVFDLQSVANYLLGNHLQTTQADAIKKVSLRNVQNILKGSEFYQAKGLEFLRTELLLNCMRHALEKQQPHISQWATAPQEHLRNILNALLLENPDTLYGQLIPHIKRAKTSKYNDRPLRNIHDLFCELSTSEWIDFENIKDFIRYREIQVNFLLYAGSFSNLTTQRSRFMNAARIDIHADNEWALIALPALQGICFMLAAFGFLEISFDAPENNEFRRSAQNYLTPFDSLRAIRLTPLGAYAFGLTDAFDYTTSNSEETVVTLNAQRLTASCQNIDPLTELSLSSFMEKIAPSFYRMTRQSLIRGCKNSKEIEQRIEQFKQTVAPAPPPNWDAFFDQVLATAEALSPRPELVVYQLTNTPELRQLFASDPSLRQLVKKCEGFHIVFHKKDQTAIARRLTELGYLMNTTD
ncbi:hypothetical protein ACFLQY_02930 [Verrucomicrobiota bacterium]